MKNKTKVSLAQAAKMAGVARSTFYRHIEEKGISIEDKDTPRPKVDVSELVRVYGDQIKTPEQLQKEKQKEQQADKTVQDTSIEDQIELRTLREKIKHMEQLQSMEKNRLEEQIELLREMLDSEREERKKATALLTDQRSEKEKQTDRLTRLEREIQNLQGRGLWERLFGQKERAA